MAALPATLLPCVICSATVRACVLLLWYWNAPDAMAPSTPRPSRISTKRKLDGIGGLAGQELSSEHRGDKSQGGNGVDETAGHPHDQAGKLLILSGGKPEGR